MEKFGEKFGEQKQEDLINNPPHYDCESVIVKIEPIELCEQCGFLMGNALKYIFRYQNKGKPLEDLQKARFYLERWLQKNGDEWSDADTRVFGYGSFVTKVFLQHKEFLKIWNIDRSTRDNVRNLREWVNDKIKVLEIIDRHSNNN